ncbi:hypothetical protein I553_0543 [Mycobacterium xenopi 4042]|uniref:Uncharacterized protein n=1 Tax=Mycobacterium xenopi 4042 TaxID=1299334 RepID=X7YK41_MYCXE|nr:hypothetical protein I553_0543 [Mycobacterium xenopi 4042]
MLAAAVGENTLPTLAARRRSRRAGPLRQRPERLDAAVAQHLSGTAGLACAQHPGSFLRQLGWHAQARRWDGRALALAGDDPEAVADALLGLAADALGLRRFAVAETLLRRADKVLAGAAETGCSVRPCAGRGWPPSWRWRSVKAAAPCVMPRRPSSSHRRYPRGTASKATWWWPPRYAAPATLTGRVRSATTRWMPRRSWV